MAQSIKDFIADSYQLVSASSPTVPLQGDDMSKGLQFLNELISYYSATELMLTIAKENVYTLQIGQPSVTYAAETFTPTPDVIIGRLANLQNQWLVLDGVTYPMINESRNTFFASYKYQPQQGLPRYVIVRNDTNVTTVEIYPRPSQEYEFHVFGKFEMPPLIITGDMSGYPTYYIRYLRFALAKDLSYYKGRTEAWTEKLEGALESAKDEMMAVSSVNLNIEADHESYLNGSWRVRAGI